MKKTTDGKGVDVIVDFVGKAYWQRNIDSLAVDGRMTMLALLSGESFASLFVCYDTFDAPAVNAYVVARGRPLTKAAGTLPCGLGQ